MGASGRCQPTLSPPELATRETIRREAARGIVAADGLFDGWLWRRRTTYQPGRQVDQLVPKAETPCPAANYNTTKNRRGYQSGRQGIGNPPYSILPHSSTPDRFRGGVALRQLAGRSASAWPAPFDQFIVERIAHTNTPSAIASMRARTSWNCPSRIRSAGLRWPSCRFGENIQTLA